MRAGEPIRIGAAGAALGLALLGLVASEGRARANGREVALPMEAPDPRGLLTGQYVELEFREALPEGAPCPPGAQGAPVGSFEGMRPAWVALHSVGPGWRVAGSAPTRREALRLGRVAVRGRASCGGDQAVDLDIGIDRFHADQGEAEAIERLLRNRRPGEPVRAYALVSVGRDGRARLNGVQIDGRRVELDWF
ncbi:MAG: GDYXXLXY domain-containing protein [Proteobacteria bacterium]|nr:GDYXXLXY domain-containing protein [Pseudomonadota bacterium]